MDKEADKMDSSNGTEPPIEYLIKMLLKDSKENPYSLTKIAELIGLYSEFGTVSGAISPITLKRILTRLEGQGILESKNVNNEMYYMLMD